MTNNILNSALEHEHELNTRGGTHEYSHEEVILASKQPKKKAGRRVFKETRHPVYRGVRRRNNNKWVCETRVPNNNSRIWLGTYPTPQMAARAHDVAALALRGKSACLNFADSVWRLTVPATTDALEIRRAAVEAAELFADEDVNVNVNESEQELQQSVMTVTASESVEQVEEHVEQERRDLLLRIADEPLMSPPPPYARDGRDWHDVDVFDAEVSLWDFSI